MRVRRYAINSQVCLHVLRLLRTERDHGTKQTLVSAILHFSYKLNPYSLCKCISKFLIRFLRDGLRWGCLVFALLRRKTGLHMLLVIII